MSVAADTHAVLLLFVLHRCIWGNKDDCELIGQLLLDFAKNSFDALMGLLNSELDCVLDLFTAPFQLMPALASSITRLAPANNLITMYTNLYTQLQQGGYCNGRDDCIAKFPNLKAQFGALDSMVLLYAAVAGATQTVSCRMIVRALMQLHAPRLAPRRDAALRRWPTSQPGCSRHKSCWTWRASFESST